MTLLLASLAAAPEPAAPEPAAPEPAASAARPALDLLVGEALIEQSSGRHRPQPALLVDLVVPVAGRFGLAAEVFATTAADRTALVELDQHVVRPALLGTIAFERPGAPGPRFSPSVRFDLALGPAVTVTTAVWTLPALAPATVVEPGVRGRAGLAVGLGQGWSVRGQGGLAWRASGVDHDYAAGVAWAW